MGNGESNSGERAGVSTSTDDVLAAHLGHHPDVLANLRTAHDQAWQAVDPVLLELVRLRVAELLGNRPELAVRTPAAVEAGLDEATISDLSHWPTSSRFGPRERACLAFTEQWILDVASLSDDDARAVSDVLGADGLAAFASALLVIEQRQRLRLAWSRLFPTEEAA
jgi:alkylhydroperoxidase family enzyme